MRLTFQNGEHPEVMLEKGQLTLGSAPDNQIVLANAGLAPQQALFAADRRGLWLCVPPEAPPVHLNARPVHRLALLRAGDLLTLQRVQVLLRADDERVEREIPSAAPAPLPDAERTAALRVLLRGVAGPHFGRSYPLDAPLLIGRSTVADVRIDDPAVAERQAQLELHGDRVVLRHLGGEGCVLNGIPVRDAVLSPGDQLVFEQHRFVLEAPGLPSRDRAPKRAVVAPPPPDEEIAAAPEAPPEPQPERSGTAWWLIAAAAALAAALTALLIYAPRLGG